MRWTLGGLSVVLPTRGLLVLAVLWVRDVLVMIPRHGCDLLMHMGGCLARAETTSDERAADPGGQYRREVELTQTKTLISSRSVAEPGTTTYFYRAVRPPFDFGTRVDQRLDASGVYVGSASFCQ